MILDLRILGHRDGDCGIDGKWHTYFALFPVELDDGKFACFQIVQRRLAGCVHIWGSFDRQWEYKLK